MALITYTDKATMNENADIPAVNKVQASDMNEIKSVVNANWNALGDYVVEQGTDYIKYNSGILIQWGYINFTSKLANSYGSIYIPASQISKTFSVAFIDNTYSVVTTALSDVNSFYTTGKTTNSFSGYPISYVARNDAANRYVYFIAIGKWK